MKLRGYINDTGAFQTVAFVKSLSPQSQNRHEAVYSVDGDQDASLPSPACTAGEPQEWLIRKGGYYYRPNCAGYTTSKFEAGRYTEAEARKEAEIEPWHMSALHQDEVPDDPASASVGELKARIADLEGKLAEAIDTLKFYANPDIYKPHPHGPAFDRRDLSFSATSTLSTLRTKP